MSNLLCIDKWLEENEPFFLPPVCNKLMHNTQLKVFFVGGPNTRSDYHMEEGEEFFYMIKGDMCLKIIENGNRRDIIIRQGEVFLLPAKTQHSPQRYKNTIGLVIERERLNSEWDLLRYFVKETTKVLFERWFYCQNLDTQLPPLINEFLSSKEHKTGQPSSNSINKDPPYLPDENIKIENPFSLENWIEKNSNEIKKLGKKSLFSGNYQSNIVIYGGQDTQTIITQDFEAFIWQIIGKSKISIEGQSYDLLKGKTFLQSKESKCLLLNNDGYTLVISMPPKVK